MADRLDADVADDEQQRAVPNARGMAMVPSRLANIPISSTQRTARRSASNQVVVQVV